MAFGSKIKNLFEEEDVDTFKAEKTAYEVISSEKANEILNSDCSKFQQQQQIFNIVPRDKAQGDSEFMIYDPLAEKKPFDKKYHVMFMGASESWKNLPSRRNAIVAYASKDKVSDDGVTYIAIPYNNTKLGVCAKDSLANSFNNVAINLGMKFEYFDRSFNILLNIFNNPEGTYEQNTKKLTLTNEQFYDESYESLYTAINKADNQLSSTEGKQIREAIQSDSYNKETESNVVSILEYLEAKNISIKEMIDNLFDPSKNNFKTMAFKDIIVGELKNNELWFNNKCLLVKESSFQQLSFGGGATTTQQPPQSPENEVSSEPEVSNEPSSDELKLD